MSNTKLKPTSFNLNNKDDAELLKAIEKSGYSFSKVTKMLWDRKLKAESRHKVKLLNEIL